MKHYFKKLPVFLYICVVLITFSCSEEKDFVKEQNRISTVNLEDLPFLQKELNKNKSKGQYSKEGIVFYLDRINTKEIIQFVDQQGLKSYTFSLNYKKQDTLFNLCAKETAEGYNYSLLKYSTTNLEEWIQDIKNTGNSLIQPETKVEKIDSRAIVQQLCIRFVTVCPSGQHTLDQIGSCDFSDRLSEWIESYQIYACDNSGGGGGPSNSSNDTATTIPNVSGDDDSDLDIEKPCRKLAKLADPLGQNIKPEIDNLKNKVIANTPIEWGVGFKKMGPTTLYADESLFTYQNVQVQGNANDVPMTIGQQWIGGAHCHTENGIEIPSWKDVQNLFLASNAAQYNIRSQVTNMVVVPNPYNPSSPNVYAIKIDNIATFNNKLTADLADPKYAVQATTTITVEEAEAMTIDKIQKELAAIWSNSTNLEKSFLEKFKDYGISLYKADSDDLDQWSKLKLSPGYMGTGVQPIPCIFQ